MLDKLTAVQRKVLSWLGFCVVIGIGFMMVQPSTPPSPRPREPSAVPSPADASWGSGRSYEEWIERELAVTLRMVQGVGDVKVFVTLDRGTSIEIAQTMTQDERVSTELDGTGRPVRTSEEKRTTSTPVTLRLEGERKEVPLILQEYDPVVRGVLVVAKGAADPSVRYQIAGAVQAVLQIPMYQIEVLPKENER